MRIKQGGVYSQDIGLVEGLLDCKVWVRLIPRIEPMGQPEKRNTKTFLRRVPQKLNLRPQHFDAVKQKELHAVTKKYMYSIRNQLFHRGFVYRPFAFK